ncbi:PREDICTED: autophagy protein 12-like [Ceratosolen solmsi marchali]|uniref:Ubiquitin-like protein ATG12 n=1 Tax=Ceratosolen solmsi marchali TaxID=326594 RepID=A0AAJ6YER1_9HYME|nr:PREDICTED: autophagy protein 12-like [Ceratosolen solmsi marchali]
MAEKEVDERSLVRTATTTTSDEVPQNLETLSSDTNPSHIEAPLPPVKEKKIEVLLKATGDAPIMMKKKWVVSPDNTIGWISEFIKKCIKLGAEERLFLYINQTFAPAPDQTVKNLYDCYGTDGKLIIHYCKTQAWG